MDTTVKTLRDLNDKELDMILLYRAGKHEEAAAAMLRIAADNIEADLPKPEPKPAPKLFTWSQYFALQVIAELGVNGHINTGKVLAEKDGLTGLLEDVAKAIDTAAVRAELSGHMQ